MTWKLELSGHITAENATAVEQALFEEIVAFARRRTADAGITSSLFVGQHTGALINFHEEVSDGEQQLPPA